MKIEHTFRGWKMTAEDMRPDYEGPQVFVESPCGRYTGSSLLVENDGIVCDANGEEQRVPHAVVEEVDTFEARAYRELGFIL